MALPPDDDPQWDLLAARIREFRKERPDHEKFMIDESRAIMALLERDDPRFGGEEPTDEE